MKKLIVLLAMLTCASFAQPSHVQQMFYTGSSLQYVCDAPINVPATSVSRSAGTLASIVVATNVGTVTTSSAHGLWVGARVTVSGSGTAALNASYVVATVPSTTTYTIATSGVPDAAYSTGLVITTNSPLLTSPVWSVTVMHYTAGTLDGVYLGGSSASSTAKCSDRTTF
jgi:hypothetical protein